MGLDFPRAQNFSYQHYSEVSQTCSLIAWALNIICKTYEVFHKETRTHEELNGLVFNQSVTELLNWEHVFVIRSFLLGFHKKIVKSTAYKSAILFHLNIWFTEVSIQLEITKYKKGLFKVPVHPLLISFYL